MKITLAIFCSILLPVAVVGCGRIEDTFIKTDTAVVTDDGEYQDWLADQNEWIYQQMKTEYFWSSEMKDSIDCDFSLEPAAFFESLLVDEDRFSYCVPNGGYVPRTKVSDLNESVSFDSLYVVGSCRIGYFVFDEFATTNDVVDIILRLKSWNVDDVIVDLRYNPGGSINTCVALASYLGPKLALGKIFCSYRYNERIQEGNIRSFGTPYTYTYFNSDANTMSRCLDLKRLFVLTGKHSASCSELLINCLRPYMDVISIGERTVGKDVGMSVLQGRYYKYKLYPICFRTYNALGDSVSVSGLNPDYYMEDSFPSRLGQLDEPLLGKAVQLATCGM